MEQNLIIKSLYGMTNPKPSKEHQKKLQAAINMLGNRYVLANPINKKASK